MVTFICTLEFKFSCSDNKWLKNLLSIQVFFPYVSLQFFSSLWMVQLMIVLSTVIMKLFYCLITVDKEECWGN